MKRAGTLSAVTLQTIAHLAQCSRTTVALALRHDPQIPAATRERVLRVAREAGYEPGLEPAPAAPLPHPPAFQAALGMLHTVTRRFAVETPGYADWMMGAADRGAQMGYLFEDFWVKENGTTVAELEQQLESHHIQGLLLPCFPSAEHLPSQFHPLLRRYPAVATGFPAEDLPALPVVANDRHSTGLALFDRAAHAGYQRIGFILSDRPEVPGAHDLLSVIAGVQENCGELAPLPALFCPPGGVGDFLHWIALYRPDCIITTVEEVWDWLKEANQRVPQDLGFLFWQMRERGHGWSGMTQNDREIGAAALELIVRQLHSAGREAEPLQNCVLIESTWVEGKTIRPTAQLAAR